MIRMPKPTPPQAPAKPPQPNLFALVAPERGFVAVLLLLAVTGNALSLSLPKVLSGGIDAFNAGVFDLHVFLARFFAIAFGVLVAVYGQAVVQSYLGEKVARGLRTRLADKISRRSFADVLEMTPAKLLTNLTSDVDAAKMFVSQAIVSIVSSAFLILGAGTLLLATNWKLGLATLVILPIIAISFRSIFTRVGGLFASSQQVVDRLNKTINESILGAALIRILNAQVPEGRKFEAVNTEAKDIGFKILGVFSGVIPIITFVASMATIIVLAFGGHLVIVGDMTVGELAAFNGYLSLLIFPIFIIGFMSNAIARAGASYGRILAVLELPGAEEKGTLAQPIRGDIVADKVSVRYGEKPVLKEASFAVKAGTRTAVIGPTAAGKTQLLQVLTGLIPPTSGAVRYDGHDIAEYVKASFHAQVAFVFQDSVLFNASVRENIAFSASVTPEALDKAIATAELGEFIASLPQGIETVVSERGTSLSGGQKQRVMLARALALEPTVLILDDFTARVDVETEKRILANVRKNYPGITVISVTQKIAPVEDYDQIVLLMEGEILAAGTHAKLLETSPEYVQIVESQKSTEQYESHA